LVGRIFTFNLYPFNFREYLRYCNPALCKKIYWNIKKEIDEYIYGKAKSPPEVSDNVIKEINRYYCEYAIFGGYPRVVLAEDSDEKIMILKNIYNTYFLREIRDILQLSTEAELQKLIKALSMQIGSLVAYNELCQISSLNYGNLTKHLNILEKTFVIKRTLPFYTNKRVEIAKSPKIYFIDNGFRNIATGNFQRFGERSDRGSLNENFVAGQLLKDGCNINYWRTKSHAEVDFVLEEKGRKVAIEVKSILHSNKVGRALLSFQEKYSPYRTVVVSENRFSFDKERNILFMPMFFI